MVRFLLAIGAVIATASAAIPQDLKSYELEAEQVLQRLRGAMMQEMQKAMQIGPKAAIGVCRHLAPQIEEQIERETGWEVRRTGLRVRNPANSPEAHERSIMMSYDIRAKAGQGPELLRTVRLIDRGGKRMVHFMQAIPTFDGCLACHGKKVAQEVMEEIKTLYPSDQATGYDVGDIRGAFSLYKDFEPARHPIAQQNAEWDKIAALELPASLALDEQGKSGNAVSGRDMFKRHCIICHSPSDIAKQFFGPYGIAKQDSACEKLETHGRTDPAHDCDIVAFLKALSFIADTK